MEKSVAMINRQTFDTLASVVMIAASVYLATAVYQIKTRKSAAVITPYEVGEDLSAVPALGAHSQDRALVLFVQSSCHFCTASMPFYQRLAQTPVPSRSL
jgi:hypothetical protein